MMRAFRGEIDFLYNSIREHGWEVPDLPREKAFSPVRWAFKNPGPPHFTPILLTILRINIMAKQIATAYRKKQEPVSKEDYAYVAYHAAPLLAYEHLLNTSKLESRHFRDWFTVGMVMQEAKLWSLFSEGVCAFPDEIKE